MSKENKPTKIEVVVVVVFLVMGLIAGFLFGILSTLGNDEKIREEYFAQGSNLGWNECRDNWINSLIGLKDNCFYETNENNTMVRHVCGELTSGWRKID